MKYLIFTIIVIWAFATSTMLLNSENRALRKELQTIKDNQQEIISKAVTDSLNSPAIDSLRQKIEIKSAELRESYQKIEAALEKCREIQYRMERENAYAERLMIERQRLLKQLNY